MIGPSATAITMSAIWSTCDPISTDLSNTVAPGVCARFKKSLCQALRQSNRHIAIGQTRAPTIQATGVSVPELENYLLAQPGISPELAQAIRALGDPTTTLPVPIPLDKAISHPVQVQGVPGLSIADSTGIGGGIVWEKNGMIYGVGGTFSEEVLLRVANSLK